jgi:hypothetical protein
VTLQIVEAAQIAPEQLPIMQDATHFNPVDMVVAVRDRHGGLYDLHRFADPDACFLASKSSGGRTLRALELPGLWNGQMAKWNTVFVEIPTAMFRPVKELADLIPGRN